MDFFGPNHSFKTYLAIDGDDLWLIGTGDTGIGDLNLAKRTGGTQMSVLDRFAVVHAAQAIGPNGDFLTREVAQRPCGGPRTARTGLATVPVSG